MNFALITLITSYFQIQVDPSWFFGHFEEACCFWVTLKWRKFEDELDAFIFGAQLGILVFLLDVSLSIEIY